MATTRANQKKSSRKSPPKKRWMHAVGGYSSIRYVVIFVAGMAVIGTVIGLTALAKPKEIPTNPLTGFSHTPNTPNPDEILTYINAARRLEKVAELSTDSRLTAVAEERLDDMIKKQYYSHKNLAGKFFYELFPNHGFTAQYSCENLDIETSLDAKVYVEDWLDSNAGHKECLVHGKVKKVGIATGIFAKAVPGSATNTTYLAVAVFATTPQDK